MERDAEGGAERALAGQRGPAMVLGHDCGGRDGHDGPALALGHDGYDDCDGRCGHGDLAPVLMYGDRGDHDDLAPVHGQHQYHHC
ncbi:unnamed protein product [Miscanthus lutarioriparius]|uniref:Uncharacterized protein n=1 Tax=Miscanthus lutarioriparius TaxID=422564 RepID=A0A811RCZ1_9POAL|nr:unnamed protein product [Miscanthus lutarioriparius]